MKIDRAFMRGITADGKHREYADDAQKGLTVRVSPAGRIAYTIRWVKPNGKQGRATIGYYPTMNLSAAREAARKVLRNTEVKRDSPEEILEKRRRRSALTKRVGSSMTVGDFIDQRYGPWLTANTRSGGATIGRLKKAFSTFQDAPLNLVTASEVEEWRTQRIKSGRVSNTTINRDVGALRGLFSRALEWELIDRHPLTRVKALKTPEGKVRWLADDEEEHLRQALDTREERERAARISGNAWRAARNYEPLPDLAGLAFVDHLKPLVLISLNTGARRGELLSLTWGAVDLDRAVLSVYGATAKSGKTRHIPLNEEALETFRLWKAQSTGDLVFPSPKTDRSIQYLKTAWGKLLNDAGIENFRWHDLRHHFASRLVMCGVDLNTVRELLGHSDLKMTLRYAHLAPEHKAAAVAKLMGRGDGL